MKLDSVRDLKSQLLETSVPPDIMASTMGAPPSARLREALAATHTRKPAEVSLGIAPGQKRRDFRLGVRIHAKGKHARALADDFQKKSHGEADIKVVPRVVAAPPKATSAPPSAGRWFRSKRRPLEAGLSAGHYDITAGTLGFVVEDENSYYLLSNNHVLADVNAGQPGDPIFQPGPMDRTVSRSTLVGVLDHFIPISFIRSNLVDCAIAELLPDIEFYVGWSEAIGGRVQGWREVDEDDLGARVFKVGRTTGITEGVITQVEIDRLRVDMGPPGTASFSDQLEIQGLDGPFSLGGDSGSLIVDEDAYAIGLLFAGGPSTEGVDLTFANPIWTVLESLGVGLVL